MTNGYNEKEQAFANSRLAAREQANRPWGGKDTSLQVGDHRSRGGWNNEPRTNRPTEGVAMEQGPRDVVHCCLPWTKQEHGDVHRELREMLCEVAGGYTAFPHIGGWIDGNGYVQTEDGYTYEVSFPAGDTVILQNLIEAFQHAGRRQGEQWTHIEYHKAAFEAKHTKTA